MNTCEEQKQSNSAQSVDENRYYRDENFDLYAIIDETDTHYLCEGLKGDCVGKIVEFAK